VKVKQREKLGEFLQGGGGGRGSVGDKGRHSKGEENRQAGGGAQNQVVALYLFLLLKRGGGLTKKGSGGKGMGREREQRGCGGGYRGELGASGTKASVRGREDHSNKEWEKKGIAKE